MDPDRTDIRQKMIEFFASEGRINEVLSESSALADIFLKTTITKKPKGFTRTSWLLSPATSSSGTAFATYTSGG